MEDGFSLTNLTVLELQQECKRRGLKKTGVKAKLIQRLAEYIEKHGAKYIEQKEKVTPVVEPSVEKSVLTIHNPHPYMEEYEEQLIESVNREKDVNNYFTSKKTKEVKEVKNKDEVETPDSDAPIPFPEAPSAETPESDVPYVENPDDEAQVGSPTYPATRATRNTARNPRDIAEELTEPIHKSPTYCKSPNGRIVELPEGNSQDTAVCDDELDAEEKEERVEADPHEYDDAPHDDEQMDETNDVNEALHTETNAEVETGEASDYVEDENGDEERHENEPENCEEDDEVHEENENNEEENGEMEQEEETVEKEDDIADYDDGDEDNYDDRDRENYADGDNEDDVDRDNENEDVNGENEEYVGDNENDGDNENYADGEDENYADGDPEDYVEEQEDMDDESRSIEDGEITINVENQNDFEDRQDDDRLDVSVQDEKIAEDNEAEDVGSTIKQPKKIVVPVTLKKRISLVASTDSAEERAAKRKRRWGSTSTSMRQSDVAISSESIKKLIPDMKIDAAAFESVPELDYQEDETSENITEMAEENAANEDAVDAEPAPSPPKIFKVARSVKVDSVKKITLEKPTNTSQEVVTVESESDAVATPSTPLPPTPKPSVRNYVIDDEIEVQEEREKSPSPAKNPSSQYIHIENLVRPYTISQLKAVVGRTGHICEELEAAATRDALHGLRWPAGSPKLLKIDFAVNEQMHKETTGLLGQKPKVVIEIDDNQSDQVVITDERTRGSRREDSSRDSRRKRIPPTPKENEGTKEKEKDKKDPEREESPAKLLDDLFRKTKATPCIYWLPLTDEQIVKLEESRTR